MAQYQYTATSHVTLRVTVQCEACDHIFEYDNGVEAGSSSIGGKGNTLKVLDNARNAEERLRGLLTAIGRGNCASLGTHKCPACRYLQSYMVVNKKGNDAVGALSCLGATIFCLLMYALFRTNSDPDWFKALVSLLIRFVAPVAAALCGVGAALFAYGYISNPNRSWLRKHKVSTAPFGRAPLNITVVQ
jgi:hypothetical protein